MGSEVILPESHVRNLGAIFDSHLKMDQHVSKTVQSMYAQICYLGKVRPFMDQSTTAKVVNALVIHPAIPYWVDILPAV